jgi:WD40 repeat protein
MTTGRELCRVNAPEDDHYPGQGHLAGLTFAPSGKSFITCGLFDGLIERDVTTGKEMRRFGHGRVGPFGDLTLSPDGKTVAVTGGSDRVALIDVSTGNEIVRGIGNPSQINEVTVAPDGKTVVTSSPTPSLFFWDAKTGRLQGTFGPPEHTGFHYQLADGGRTAYACNYKGTEIRGLDLPSGRERFRLSAKIFAVARGGSRIAVQDNSGDGIDLVNTETGKRLGGFTDPGLKGSRGAFTADGRTLFAFCEDHTIQVWDVDGRVKVRQFGPVGDREPSRAVIVPLGQKYSYYHATPSPDGTRFTYSDEHGYLALHDATSGEELWRLDRQVGGLNGVTFSPDGRTLAVPGRGDSTLHLLEASTGRERQALAGHRGEVYSVGFSADGTTLVTGSPDTTAVVWDLTGRLAAGRKWDTPPSRAELDARWSALARDEAAEAFRAIQRIATSPSEGVAYLAEKLRPVVDVDAKTLAQLIADLESDQFATREKADSELERIGEPALAACRKALAGRSGAELRRRLETFVDNLATEKRIPSRENLRVLRAIEALERCGTPAARRVLESLAGGFAVARPTQEAKASLARLSQHERRGP